MLPTPFLDRTYDETLALLTAARDYLTYAVPSARSGLSDADRLRISCEAMRVTARLSHVMAWLLAQRAVGAGELSRADAAKAYKLSDDDVCLLETEATADGLPSRLCELLAASRALYARVGRLDTMVRDAVLGE